MLPFSNANYLFAGTSGDVNLTDDVVDESLSLMLLQTILLVPTPLWRGAMERLAALRPRRREDIMVEV